MDLYSAFIVVPHTQDAQVRITQCYLQITPYLPLHALAYKLYILRCSSVTAFFLVAGINEWNSVADIVSFTSLLAFKRSIRMANFHEFLMCNNEQSFKATVIVVLLALFYVYCYYITLLWANKSSSSLSSSPLPSCEHYILNMNELISMHIGTSGP